MCHLVVSNHNKQFYNTLTEIMPTWKKWKDTLEQKLAATLQAQGQKVLHDLSAELAHSIKAELNRFSMRYSTVETPELVALVEQKNSTPQQKISKYFECI